MKLRDMNAAQTEAFANEIAALLRKRQTSDVDTMKMVWIMLVEKVQELKLDGFIHWVAARGDAEAASLIDGLGYMCQLHAVRELQRLREIEELDDDKR